MRLIVFSSAPLRVNARTVRLLLAIACLRLRDLHARAGGAEQTLSSGGVYPNGSTTRLKSNYEQILPRSTAYLLNRDWG
jgi:hypothetical protein